MKTHQIILTQKQAEIALCKAQYITMIAGRRFGKTEVLKARIKLTSRKDCKSNIPSLKYSYTYVTPLYSQGEEVFQSLIGDAGFRHLIKKHKMRPFLQLYLTSGARVKFKSFQRPEYLRSTGEDEINLDEIQDPCYTEDRINKIVRPMLLERRGRLVIAGQFRGLNWYYHNYFHPGQVPHLLDSNGKMRVGANGQPIPNTKYRSWAISTEDGFMFQDDEGRQFLQDEIASMPKAVVDQEIRSIPSANQNAVFSMDDVEWIRENSPPKHSSPIPGARYICGLDLGGQVDYSQLVVMQWLPGDKGHVVDVIRFPLRNKHDQQAHVVGRISERWSAPVVADNTGGAVGGMGHRIDAVFRHYRQHVRDLREYTFNPKSKKLLIRNMQHKIQQHAMTIPTEFAELHDQLSKYECVVKHGNEIYGAPQGEHDDALIAFGLAMQGGLHDWAGGNGGHSVSTAMY